MATTRYIHRAYSARRQILVLPFTRIHPIRRYLRGEPMGGPFQNFLD